MKFDRVVSALLVTYGHLQLLADEISQTTQRISELRGHVGRNDRRLRTLETRLASLKRRAASIQQQFALTEEMALPLLKSYQSLTGTPSPMKALLLESAAPDSQPKTGASRG